MKKRIKAFDLISYAFLSSFIFLPLNAQPYGYPYDPYNLPEDPYYGPNSPYYRPNYAPSPNYRMDASYYRQPERPPMHPMPPQRPRMPPSQSAYPQLQQTAQQPYVNPSEEKIDQILDFWFGSLSGPLDYPGGKISLWEGTSEEVPLIKDKFMEDYQRAVLGQYN
ncbi:MAG: hypothetical protein ACHQUC_04780, partial [Chlamydiales bacterium]